MGFGYPMEIRQVSDEFRVPDGNLSDFGRISGGFRVSVRFRTGLGNLSVSGTRGRKVIPVPVPARSRVGYGYDPRIKFRVRARARLVGYPYPWVKLASLAATATNKCSTKLT